MRIAAAQEGLGEDPVVAMDSTPQQADAAAEHQPSLSQHPANSASSTETVSFEGFANVGERKRRCIPDDLLPKVCTPCMEQLLLHTRHVNMATCASAHMDTWGMRESC